MAYLTLRAGLEFRGRPRRGTAQSARFLALVVVLFPVTGLLGQSPGPRCHYQSGIHYFEKGNLDAAEREFREALEMSPYFVEARQNLAVALAKKGEIDAAARAREGSGRASAVG